MLLKNARCWIYCLNDLDSEFIYVGGSILGLAVISI
uniref:Uncharacterized protein n=1 Tax=Anguilla anguilla TaxID=7936 RepID=A0A0E9QSG3_ANGAN